MTPRRNKGIITYLFVAFAALFLIYMVTSKFATTTERTEYSMVISHFDDLEVCAYELDLGTGELTYQLRGEEEKRKYTVPSVQIFYDDTENYREKYNEKYPQQPLQEDFIKVTDRTWLYSLIPVILTEIGCGQLFHEPPCLKILLFG